MREGVSIARFTVHLTVVLLALPFPLLLLSVLVVLINAQPQLLQIFLAQPLFQLHGRHRCHRRLGLLALIHVVFGLRDEMVCEEGKGMGGWMDR